MSGDLEKQMQEAKGNRKSCLQKIEDMMEYADPVMNSMPRTEKGYSGLATKIRATMQSMADKSMDAQKAHYAKSTLKELGELDNLIEHCHFYIKHAKRMKLISFTQFDMINGYLSEVGKITGAWIKTVMESETYKKETSKKR